MKAFGSITNRIAESYCYSEDQEPYVGMGATYNSWSDRSPLTVIEIIKEKNYEIIVCQEDFAKRTDSNGMSESQNYEYSPNPDGCLYYVRSKEVISKEGVPAKIYENVRKNEKTGRWNVIKWHRTPISFGRRNKYHDFSF